MRVCVAIDSRVQVCPRVQPRPKSRIEHKIRRASRSTIKVAPTTMLRRRTPSFRAVFFIRHPLFTCADSIYIVHVVCTYMLSTYGTVVLNTTLELLLLSYCCLYSQEYVEGRMYGAKKASSVSVRSGSAAETPHPCLQWFLGSRCLIRGLAQRRLRGEMGHGRWRGGGGGVL